VALPENLTFLASSAKTTTQTQADQVNRGHSGIRVVVDTTVFGTGSVNVTVQSLDPTSGKYSTLLDSGAIVATGTVVLTMFPGAPVSGTLSANGQLPATWRLVATANNANSQTYSVGYVLLP
jgi:hypothetical protein